MAAKIKGRRGSTSDHSSPPEAEPIKPLKPALAIDGSFVAHYTVWGGSGTTWVPQATIVEAKFSPAGTVQGIIHRNNGGTEDSPIHFRGVYILDRDAFGSISGSASLGLLFFPGQPEKSTLFPDPPPPKAVVFRRQELYIVKRSDAEVFFMLARSYGFVRIHPQKIGDEPQFVFQQIDTGASVEGVFYKTS